MSLCLQPFTEGDIRLNISSRSNGETCDPHGFWLEFEESTCRTSKQRTWADWWYLIPALAAFIQWDTFVQIFHDTSLDSIVIHVVEVRVAVFGTDADLLHELFE
jgi:hypothetical protein